MLSTFSHTLGQLETFPALARMSAVRGKADAIRGKADIPAGMHQGPNWRNSCDCATIALGHHNDDLHGMNSTGNNGLTPKQRRFCEKYVACLEAKRAAIEAGYTERSATVTSTRLMKRPEVQQYIAQLQAKLAERNAIDQDSIVRKLRENHDAAKGAGQYNACNRALELEAKIGGLLKDRVHLTGLQETSDDDLIENLAKGDAKKAATLRELLGAGDGFDAPGSLH